MGVRAQYWLLVAATFGVYATMVLWTLPSISADAGGLATFDMRPGGYTLEEARAFLSALGPDGRALYTGPQRILDMAYPIMLAVVLSIALGHFIKTGWRRWMVMALPIIGAAADYMENWAVAGMLRTDPADLTARTVEAASRWSVLKATSTTIAMLVLLIVMAFTLGRWLGARRRS